MQEDLKILLEWFIANGITDLFYNDIEENNFDFQYKFEKPVVDKRNTGLVVRALARQQEEIKELNFVHSTKSRDLADKINNIEDILKNILELDIYKNFIKTASSTVILNGNTKANILIINDLPNDEDDINGDIFSGKTGILLKNMMKAINLEENDYCLLNSFFWRLPGNRNPIKEELNLCKPFVEKIIAIIKPKLIIFMGSYAISSIFEENKTLISLHGKFFDYTNCYLQGNIKVTGVYGPNFLMKNQAKKRDAWNDLLKIKDFLDN